MITDYPHRTGELALPPGKTRDPDCRHKCCVPETDWAAVDDALRNPPQGPVEYQVVQHGAFLATRHVGRQARHAVEALLAVAGAGERVTLDFTGVEAVTGAFADELVANLVQAHGQRIAVAGAGDEVAATIRHAIERRRGTAQEPA